MSIGFFTDKTHQPAPEEIASALGEKGSLWADLIEFIAQTYQMEGPISYGGKNYGWNLWYRKSGKSLASLYPQQNAFVVQIVLGNAQVEAALQLSLSEQVGKLLRETPQLHDGRWLFIPVSSQRDVDDIKQLLLVKKKPARRKNPEASPSAKGDNQ